VADLAAAECFLQGKQTILEVIQALDAHGYGDIAERILEMQRQRIIGDYLQPSAIFEDDFRVLSAINDPNDYQGPGTGYRPAGKRWRIIRDLPQAVNPREVVGEAPTPMALRLQSIGPARQGVDMEVVVALGPAFGGEITTTIGGLSHSDVLREVMTGIAEEAVSARVVRVVSTSDCAFIGHEGAKLSGSGVAIGIQSKGTTVIHQRGLEPLNNLELFPQAPALSLDLYREIGRNAARYAKGEATTPLSVPVDNTARLRLIVKATLMHLRETKRVVLDALPLELKVTWHEEPR